MIAYRVDEPDDDERDTSAQDEGSWQPGGPEVAAVTCAPVVDPAQLWLHVARVRALDEPHVYSNERMSWPALARWLRDHERGATKASVHLWAPTLYAKMYRKDVNVVSSGAAVLDFDHVTPDWSLLEPYEYVAHTSFSHADDDPRWRVIIPLVEPVPVEQWAEAWGRFHFWLGPTADASCSNPSRADFNPSCPKGAQPQAIYRAGRALDWHELPPMSAVAPDGDDEVIGTAATTTSRGRCALATTTTPRRRLMT